MPVRFKLITSFRAEGSIGKSLAAQIYGGLRIRDGPRYRKKATRYAEIQSNAPEGYPDSPGIWVSNEGFLLGQVNFPGYVSLKTLFGLLNQALNLRGKRGGFADFRKVYKTWRYKWQVVEVPYVPRNREKGFKETKEGKTRVVERKRGNSRNGSN